MIGGAVNEDEVRRAVKTITFTGAANLGEIGAVPLFTVTGQVVLEKIVAECTVTLGGATATLALGFTGATAALIAATTATTIAAGTAWTSSTIGTIPIQIPALMKEWMVNANIIGTVAVAAITSGAIRFTAYYRPASADGLVA